nr:oxalate:formate antiporter [Hymenolepis microstoma]
MMSYLKLRVDPNVEMGSAVWISAIALSMQGVSMPIGGALLPLMGYRAIVILGCIINSGSVLLTYYTIQKGFIYVVLTYAVTLGFGFGFSYAIIFSVAGSWFPKQRTLITGMIVGGFGLGALVFTPIQTIYINPNNLMVNNETKLFDDPELLDKVPKAFLVLGGSLAVLQLIGILLLNEKPEPKKTGDSKNEGQEERNEMKSLVGGDAESNAAKTTAQGEVGDEEDMLVAIGSRRSLSIAHSNIGPISPPKREKLSIVIPQEINYPPLQCLRRHEFYFLWIIMLCNIIPITLITASFKLVGQIHISDDRFLSGVATASSLFNSGGRIMWGAICDRFSFKGPLSVMLATWAIILFTFPYIGQIQTGSMVIYAIWVSLLFLCLSGNFVLMPGATSRLFGPDYMAVNYGMIFTGFSVGSVVCAIISEKLKGHWTLLYGMCGCICLFALFMLMWIVDPFMPKGFNLCKPCTNVLQHLQPRVPVLPKEEYETVAN